VAKCYRKPYQTATTVANQLMDNCKHHR